MALSGRLQVSAYATQTSVLDLATAAMPLNEVKTWSISSGTGANQADLLWTDQRTISASSSENLDLAGSLLDAFGTTLTFVRVKGLIVAAASTNTNSVVIGNAASNGWAGPFGATTHTLSVRPGGVIMVSAPDATAYAVTAGTGDILKVANSGAGTSVTYDIVVIGASA